ncbi:MAG: folate family ECF transporter S component [Clostridia bacterium]|nr:folate family ECF transporter S component [Clostridia bacterium]
MKKRGVNPIVRICVAAMLVAMSVVIGVFCKTLLNFFGGMMRITFENLPIIVSGLLFGPVVGAVTGALSDLISYLLSPQIHMPNFVVTAGAALIGAIPGIISRFIIRKRSVLQILVSVISSHLIGSLIVKTIGLISIYGWGVLLRIPTYTVIIAAELTLLILLYKKTAFKKLILKFDGGKK